MISWFIKISSLY